MKRKFVINPHSGSAVTSRAIATLQKFFTTETGGFDYAVARSRDAAVRITRQSLRQGTDQIVAVGGDGTVNAVVNGFYEHGRPLNPQARLAVANFGTGSDYFKSLTAGANVRDWAELVLDHEVRPVDVGRIRYGDPKRGDQYFVNMASVGMVAEVVRKKTHRFGWLPSRCRYLLPTIGSLFSYKPRRVQVETDTASCDLDILAVSVCKGIWAGGGMRFGGQVSLSDGAFDVTLFRPMKPLEMLLKLGKLYTGSFHDEPAIRKLKARRVSIRAPSPVPVEFDGELGGTTDVVLSVEPRSLRVCFPRPAPASPQP